MENNLLINKKCGEIFTSTLKFPNRIQIDESDIDLFKNLPGFSENSTTPKALGEFNNIPIVATTYPLPQGVIEFFFNDDLLGNLILTREPATKEYRFFSTGGTLKEDKFNEIINRWEKLGFLLGLEDNLKVSVAIEMDKVTQFLSSLNGRYFIDDMDIIIYPLVRKILTMDKITDTYPLNVYDFLLFTNFYYPNIKNFVEDNVEKTPNAFPDDFNPITEACLILCEYYEHFIKGISLNDFILNFNKTEKDGKY